MVAVFTIVQKRHTKAALCHQSKAVGGDFVFGFIPRRVAMIGPRNHPAGAFKQRVIGLHGKGEAGFQQHTAIVPIKVGLELDTGRIGPKPQVLHDGAGPKVAGDAQGRAVRAGFGDFDAVSGYFAARGGVVFFNIPSVKIARLVDIGPDLVATPRQTFPPCALVDHAGQGAIWQKRDFDEGVF